MNLAGLIGVTLRRALAEVRERLTLAKVANAGQEAQWLVQEALNISSAELIAYPNKSADSDKLAKLEEWLTRRENGEPLQYILGTASFYGRDFIVTPEVLIPRPDTEMLIDAALSCVNGKQNFTFLDWGTGSGCIAISLLLELDRLSKLNGFNKFNNAFAIMADASPAALNCAKLNIERYSLSERTKLLFTKSPSDIKSNPEIQDLKFEFVISNPPYIPTGKIAGLQREVLREPRMALDGGTDGMDFYRALFKNAPDWLISGGHLILEIGDETQAAILKAVAPKNFTSEGLFDCGAKTSCGIWQYKR